MRRTASILDCTCERLCVTVAVEADRESVCDCDCGWDWPDSRLAFAAGLCAAFPATPVAFEELVDGAAELLDVRWGREEVEVDRWCCDIVQRRGRARMALVAACCRLAAVNMIDRFTSRRKEGGCLSKKSRESASMGEAWTLGNKSAGARLQQRTSMHVAALLRAAF